MPDELDPKKYHVLTPSQSKKLFLVLTIVTLTVGPMLGFLYYRFAINRPAQTDREMRIQIKSGEGLSEISQLLYDKGLLNSKILFKAYVILNKFDNNIQAGTYVIPAGSSVVELAQILQHGTNDVSITFLEGWRVEEFARQANVNLGDIDYEDFVEMAKPYEGYLFPDTYSVNLNIKEDDLFQMLRNTFDEKTRDILTEEALNRAGLSKEETMIFASIVEREVRNEDDRPLVAGILIKRWRNGEIIGADATTQYSVATLKAGCSINTTKVCPSDDHMDQIQWWPQNLTVDDLQFENPYNTRKVAGLPPTPICSPSIAAINAVLNHQITSFNFYLTDNEGVTHFANTLEEHNRNIQLYL